ncbi:MAG: hypothetical protein DRR19_07925 [Candidatus Parabeggiatoa sp. nov. 1]|nr:MAG: hypothetical protein DRR19_07925 [Gammaproteobacteria bacterium]
MLRLSTLIGITALVPAVHAADVNVSHTSDGGIGVGVSGSPVDGVKLGSNVTLYPGEQVLVDRHKSILLTPLA